MLWRTRQWRLLLNLIDHLPRHSFYVEALANDEELAERDADTEPAPFNPRLSEWSPAIEVLAAIYESVQQLNSNFVAANSKSGKAPKFERWPHPESALHRIRQHRKRKKHDSLVERLLPKT